VAKSRPQVLVTHTPPNGILDYAMGREHIGMPALTQWLAYSLHTVKYHLFGHNHDENGLQEEMGILFSNAAEDSRVIEVV